MESWVDADGPVSVGDHVRVNAGMFAGKVGRIVDTTRKGLKVAVGPMAVEIKQDEVTRVIEG